MKKLVASLFILGVLGLNTQLLASDTVVEVNGVKITKDDINAYLKQLEPNQPINYDILDPKTKKKVLKSVIEMEVLSQVAKKEGANKSPEFKKMLEIAKKKLMINEWAKEQFKKSIVSVSEAKDFYNKNAKLFTIPERVHARHILLKDKKSAQDIIDQLKGLKGEELKKKFIELAKSKSTGPTASKGGDLGYFTKEQMVLPFAKAAFALKKGEITTEPVKTQFGWHVIYMEDKKEAQKLPFDKVKEQIIQKLKEQRFAKKLKQERDYFMKRAKIIYPNGNSEIK